MSDPSKAVFLSYASQDANAAKRICDALRAVGVEVWFDQSELVGGDAWDQKIRRQIKECALFVPIVSANTDARPEGYFRLEWHLAEQRTYLMAHDQPFLFPVVIDDTPDATARVPEKFREVQWTRLTVKDTPETLARRVAKLLIRESVGLPAGVSQPAGGGQRPPARAKSWGRAIVPLAGLGVGLLFVFRSVWRPTRGHEGPPVTMSSTSPAVQPLLDRLWALYDKGGDASTEDWTLAVELGAKAVALDSLSAESWAAYAHVTLGANWWGAQAPEADAQALARAQRAMSLAGNSFEARFALASVYAHKEATKEEGSRMLHQLVAERPTDIRVLRRLSEVLEGDGQFPEALGLIDRVLALAARDAAAWNQRAQIHFDWGKIAEAQADVEKSLALRVGPLALMTKADILVYLADDYPAAATVIAQLPGSVLTRELETVAYGKFWLNHRQPEKALATFAAFGGDTVDGKPKAYFTGTALAMLGRKAAALVEWRAALQQVEAKLAASPNDADSLLWQARLLACLDEREQAGRRLEVARQFAQPDELRVAETLVMLGDSSAAISDLVERWPKIIGSFRSYRSAQVRTNVLHDPAFDPLRDDPRFQAFVRQISEDPRFPLPRPGPAPSTATAAVDEKSVAVLAFANLSDDKGNEFFSDGITEELLNVLAKVPGLKVTARTSSFHFKGKDTPIPEIARQLGVAYVVEGSVRKAGDKVRITAQLIKAADGFHVWSDTFTRDLKDIFAVQDEIAGLVATNLAAKLGTATRPGARVDARAFELYMQGRVAWNRRNAEGFDRAEALFREALAIAPDFARAHAALGDVWMIRAISDGKLSLYGQRSASVVPPIEAEVQRALELDPESAEAHATLGFLRQLQHQPEEALHLLRRSVELNPNYATGHHWLAGILAHESRFEESIAEYRRAVAVDPLSPRILDNFGGNLLTLGRTHEALTLFDRALILMPDEPQALVHKAVALARLGRREEARALAGRVAKRNRLAFLLATGDRAEIEAALPGATRSDRFYLLAALGRLDEALNYFDSDDIVLEDTQDWFFDPKLVPFHHDPRFRKVIAELEFDDYLTRALAWQAANPPEKPELKP